MPKEGSKNLEITTQKITDRLRTRSTSVDYKESSNARKTVRKKRTQKLINQSEESESELGAVGGENLSQIKPTQIDIEDSEEIFAFTQNPKIARTPERNSPVCEFGPINLSENFEVRETGNILESVKNINFEPIKNFETNSHSLDNLDNSDNSSSSKTEESKQIVENSELKTFRTPLLRPPVLQFPNNQLPLNNTNELEMPLTIAQVIDLVPVYKGESAQLDQFLVTVETIYNSIVEADRALFLVVLKSKLKDKAFEVVNDGAHTTFDEIKASLTLGIKPKIDMQTATQNLFKIRQNQGESTKDYSERIKRALHQMDDATQREVVAGLRDQMVLMNQKMAKQAFEANLYNFSLKTVVISANRETLNESIDFALTQEQKFFSQRVSQINTNRINQNFQKSKPNYNTNSEYVPRPRTQYCYHCGEPGHGVPNCPHKQPIKRELKQEFKFSPRKSLPNSNNKYQKISYKPNSNNTPKFQTRNNNFIRENNFKQNKNIPQKEQKSSENKMAQNRTIFVDPTEWEDPEHPITEEQNSKN